MSAIISSVIIKKRICGICSNTINYVRRYQSTDDQGTHENLSGKSVSNYDIIIAGGGLVGTTLACAISKNKILQNQKVLLLEGAPKFKSFSSAKYSNRVSALNHGTVNLMKSIGAWDIITSERYKPVKQMQVWDASSDAIITFNHDNFSKDVAYIVENDLVLHAVYKELETAINVEIKNLAKIENVSLPESDGQKCAVTLKDGEKFTCDLLVGADGANSLVRKQMNVNNFAINYNQMGLVATVELKDPDENSVAWQRFLPTGPVALLPLNDSLSSLVWSTTPDHAKRLASMPAEEFVDALNEAFWKEYPKDSITRNAMSIINSLLGNSKKSIRQYPPSVKCVEDKSRACFPLGFSHTASYVTEGAVVIGDAAHRIHPLAGQGVNLGFGDVKCLIEVLAESIYNGNKIGNKHNLFKYERERLVNNVPIMLGVHGLQRLYSTSFTPIVMLRSIGLQITENLPPLKKLFMERAMG